MKTPVLRTAPSGGPTTVMPYPGLSRLATATRTTGYVGQVHTFAPSSSLGSSFAFGLRRKKLERRRPILDVASISPWASPLVASVSSAGFVPPSPDVAAAAAAFFSALPFLIDFSFLAVGGSGSLRHLSLFEMKSMKLKMTATGHRTGLPRTNSGLPGTLDAIGEVCSIDTASSRQLNLFCDTMAVPSTVIITLTLDGTP
mmetsp:Transcript_25421/g.66533  ORF Transcript_25421/g.66533 Transcript_25421/m.66533 type:complete len:200 (+) Transcript_25421:2495-3094(+)